MKIKRGRYRRRAVRDPRDLRGARLRDVKSETAAGEGNEDRERDEDYAVNRGGKIENLFSATLPVTTPIPITYQSAPRREPTTSRTRGRENGCSDAPEAAADDGADHRAFGW